MIEEQPDKYTEDFLVMSISDQDHMHSTRFLQWDFIQRQDKEEEENVYLLDHVM